MPIYIQKIIPRAAKHRTVIFAFQKPNLYERIFFFRREKGIMYIGHGTQWKDMETLKPVKKYIADQLRIEENKFFKQSSILN